MRIGDLIVSLAVNVGIGQLAREDAVTVLAEACGYTRHGARMQLRDWQSAQARYRDRQVPNPAALTAAV